jgi:hypothetical protein
VLRRASIVDYEKELGIAPPFVSDSPYAMQALVRGYSATTFSAATFRTALATVLAVDPRYVAVVAVANQPARRLLLGVASGVSRRASEVPAVLVDSVVAAATAAAAERLVAMAGTAAPALTAELRRLGLVDANVAFLTAAVQSPAPAAPPPPDTAAQLRVIGGLGALGLGLVVGLGCLLLIAAAVCVCCFGRGRSSKVAPGQLLDSKDPEREQNDATVGGGSGGSVREAAGLEERCPEPEAAAEASHDSDAPTAGTEVAGGEAGGDDTRPPAVHLVRNESLSSAHAGLPPVHPPVKRDTYVGAGTSERSPA